MCHKMAALEVYSKHVGRNFREPYMTIVGLYQLLFNLMLRNVQITLKSFIY